MNQTIILINLKKNQKKYNHQNTKMIEVKSELDKRKYISDLKINIDNLKNNICDLKNRNLLINKLNKKY